MTQRYRATPSTGVVEQHVLRVLSLGRFTGPVERLAMLCGSPVRNVWVALAGLAGRGLVSAERNIEVGAVTVKITTRGRAAVVHRA